MQFYGEAEAEIIKPCVLMAEMILIVMYKGVKPELPGLLCKEDSQPKTHIFK